MALLTRLLMSESEMDVSQPATPVAAAVEQEDWNTSVPLAKAINSHRIEY
jgi:hypothetical protein